MFAFGMQVNVQCPKTSSTLVFGCQHLHMGILIVTRDPLVDMNIRRGLMPSSHFRGPLRLLNFSLGGRVAPNLSSRITFTHLD